MIRLKSSLRFATLLISIISVGIVVYYFSGEADQTYHNSYLTTGEHDFTSAQHDGKTFRTYQETHYPIIVVFESKIKATTDSIYLIEGRMAYVTDANGSQNKFLVAPAAIHR